MLSCKEVAKIVSSGETLGFLGKLRLSIHLFFCKHCCDYSTEVESLKTSASKNLHAKVEASQATIKRVEQEILEKHTGNSL